MDFHLTSFKEYCVHHLFYVFEPKFLRGLLAELLGVFANLALQLGALSVLMWS